VARRSKQEARAKVEAGALDFARDVKKLKESPAPEFIAKATVALCLRITKHAKMVAVGSGVLVVIGSDVFILTAAHALEGFGKNGIMYVSYDEIFLEIIGFGCANPMAPSMNRDDDPVDVGFIRLFPASAEMLRHKALKLTNLFLEPPVLHNHWLMVSGHPASAYKRRGRAISCPLYGLQASGAVPSKYESVGVNPASHVVMNHDGPLFSEKGRKRTRHSLKGMSGCGVWLIAEIAPTAVMNSGLADPKLLAIFTGIREKYGVLVATRVQLHLKLMADSIPGFGSVLDREVRAVRAASSLQPWKK
jgi:hypothetical protein